MSDTVSIVRAGADWRAFENQQAAWAFYDHWNQHRAEGECEIVLQVDVDSSSADEVKEEWAA